LLLNITYNKKNRHYVVVINVGKTYPGCCTGISVQFTGVFYEELQKLFWYKPGDCCNTNSLDGVAANSATNSPGLYKTYGPDIAGLYPPEVEYNAQLIR
jgi:hypothetical protein